MAWQRPRWSFLATGVGALATSFGDIALNRPTLRTAPTGIPSKGRAGLSIFVRRTSAPHRSAVSGSRPARQQTAMRLPAAIARRVQSCTGGCLALLLAVLPAHAADYRIDPARSHADFGVRLFWLSSINGRFEQIDGDVTLSALHDTAVVDARIEVESIHMGSERIRRWVLAPDFFDASRFPSIHFVSVPISLAMLEKGGDLDGTLTLRGVTKPAHFEVLPSTCPLHSPQQCVISVRGTIQRSDFGMSSHRTAVSDQVQLGMMISLDYAQR